MVTSKLQEVQSTLASRGLQDVKFFFSLDVQARPNSEVERDVAYVLDTYLRGDCVPMAAIGDLEYKN
jgi:hypothetical protein